MFILTTNNELINADMIWKIKVVENNVVACYLDNKDTTILGEFKAKNEVNNYYYFLINALNTGKSLFKMKV